MMSPEPPVDMNYAQREAARVGPGNHIVLAGAGTGKTRGRANLRTIDATTFSVKATAEMRGAYVHAANCGRAARDPQPRPPRGPPRCTLPRLPGRLRRGRPRRLQRARTRRDRAALRPRHLRPRTVHRALPPGPRRRDAGHQRQPTAPAARGPHPVHEPLRSRRRRPNHLHLAQRAGRPDGPPADPPRLRDVTAPPGAELPLPLDHPARGERAHRPQPRTHRQGTVDRRGQRHRDHHPQPRDPATRGEVRRGNRRALGRRRPGRHRRGALPHQPAVRRARGGPHPRWSALRGQGRAALLLLHPEIQDSLAWVRLVSCHTNDDSLRQAARSVLTPSRCERRPRRRRRNHRLARRLRARSLRRRRRCADAAHDRARRQRTRVRRRDRRRHGRGHLRHLACREGFGPPHGGAAPVLRRDDPREAPPPTHRSRDRRRARGTWFGSPSTS